VIKVITISSFGFAPSWTMTVLHYMIYVNFTCALLSVQITLLAAFLSSLCWIVSWTLLRWM
jgi:hypothetical protein